MVTVLLEYSNKFYGMYVAACIAWYDHQPLGLMLAFLAPEIICCMLYDKVSTIFEQYSLSCSNWGMTIDAVLTSGSLFTVWLVSKILFIKSGRHVSFTKCS